MLATQVRSISYLKSHAADIVDDLSQGGEPLVITQNGEAKAVLVDVTAWEETQETMALLKILALGEQQVERGEVVGVDEAFKAARKRREGR